MRCVAASPVASLSQLSKMTLVRGHVIVGALQLELWLELIQIQHSSSLHYPQVLLCDGKYIP